MQYTGVEGASHTLAGVILTFFFLFIESQNGKGWKEPLETTKSACPARAGCT